MVLLNQGRTDLNDDDSEARFVQADSIEGEIAATVAAIKDYVKSGRYHVVRKGESRPLGFGDIAVFCRKTAQCRLIKEACKKEGIPAYLQGEVEIMSTREGKLALAWLRYVNNSEDRWGYMPIMVDMQYNPMQVLDAAEDPTHVPAILRDQREFLFRKKRRVTDLLTKMFRFYGLDNDITQAIISTISSMHRGSLLTISDVIALIEDDIENEATYPVENFIDDKAVTIMTMHKSKGLEFPAVICPFIDKGSMPWVRSDGDVFLFDRTLGVRCRSVVGRFDDYSKLCPDWRTHLALGTLNTDYSEERRLMFVALSRAKQYETVICGDQPSAFMEGLADSFTDIPEVGYEADDDEKDRIPSPEIPPYKRRRTKIGVHEILDFDSGDGSSIPEGSDEVSGKGMEYGKKIHSIAQTMCYGREVDDVYEEIPEIRKVLDSVSDANHIYAEIDCWLPLENTEATLHGIIDMIAVFEDHVEIHDWKTDISHQFEDEYRVQLSVY